MDIVVQPSVSWMEMNENIKSSGLFFPIDPGPPVCLITLHGWKSNPGLMFLTQAKIGGMIATNCRYVIALEE